MLDRTPQRRIDKIAGLVGEILSRHAVKGPVAENTELARLGLNSIDMVELMLAVEADFDLMIPASEITLDNFRSIAAIDLLVGRLLG